MATLDEVINNLSTLSNSLQLQGMNKDSQEYLVLAQAQNALMALGKAQAAQDQVTSQALASTQ